MDAGAAGDARVPAEPRHGALHGGVDGAGRHDEDAAGLDRTSPSRTSAISASTASRSCCPIRYGDWIDVNDEDSAKNWARYWRPEIQGYIHAYRAVTGVDLTNPDTVDYTMPAVHLQKRLAMQRAR